MMDAGTVSARDVFTNASMNGVAILSVTCALSNAIAVTVS
jgi:hypothetical protein